MNSIQHLCLSRDPSCSGVRPCQACFDFLLGGRVQGQMVWPSGGVLTRAMGLAGPPFNASAELASHFMRAFAQAMSDGATWITSMAEADRASRAPQVPQARRVAQPSPSQEEARIARQRELTEEEYLVLFQDQILASLPTLSEPDKARMIEGVANESLDGWSALSPQEKEILRAIFLPPAGEVSPGDEPLPSNESAKKVVDAMRNGTLGAHTLAPPGPPPPQDLVPASAAVAQIPKEASPQASPEGGTQAAGGNGTSEQEQAIPAQAAEIAHQETNPS
jgi:hypothetical protein